MLLARYNVRANARRRARGLAARAVHHGQLRRALDRWRRTTCRRSPEIEQLLPSELRQHRCWPAALLWVLYACPRTVRAPLLA